VLIAWIFGSTSGRSERRIRGSADTASPQHACGGPSPARPRGGDPGGTPPGGTPPGGTTTPPGGTTPPRNPGLVVPRKLKVGSVLKAPLIPGAKKVKYQWLRNGKPIKGARKRSYRVRRKDRGKKLSCRISGVLGGKPFKLKTKAVKVPRR